MMQGGGGGYGGPPAGGGPPGGQGPGGYDPNAPPGAPGGYNPGGPPQGGYAPPGAPQQGGYGPPGAPQQGGYAPPGAPQQGGYGPPGPAPGSPPQAKKSNLGLIIGLVVVGFLVVVGGVIGLVVANSGPAHSDDIVGSCDLRGAGSSGSDSQICMDLTTINDKVKDICSKYKLSKKSCDRKGTLGGCASHGTISWAYPDSRHKTASDVKKECSETFVTQSWK